jgi:putative ABC transport system permease protein
MFVAWRDLRFARGRFALVVAVVGLITFLVVLLSGLTEGLGRESTSLVTGLRADRIVLAAPEGGGTASFATSSLSEDQAEGWRTTPGVERVEPLGLATLRAQGTTAGTVTAVGVPAGSGLSPRPVAAGSVVLSTGAADDLCGSSCEDVVVGGRPLTVVATAGEASYSHTPVVWMALEDWHTLPGASEQATALAVTKAADGLSEHGVDLDAGLDRVDGRLGTISPTPAQARSAVPSFTSENGSLQMMRGLLFGISALVVGAFFTVWTMQRTADVAALKALGASTVWVLRDAVLQAALVLALGVGLGALVATMAGALAGDAVPLVLDPGTLTVPVLLSVGLGLAGAAVSVLKVARVDPLTALGASR